MAKTRVSCPNCRQAVTAEVEQLFDTNTNPDAKQMLLSGMVNVIQCQFCGYQGQLSTPVVYHDPEKELLLTYVPAEMGLPQAEQERMLGGLITKVVNALPQEKRKAYLFRAQPMLTYQGLMERILEADGITREMIQDQQAKLRLIQRLLSANSPDVMEELIKQEEKLIDNEFFALLGRLGEASMQAGDQQSAQMVSALQQMLLQHTAYGRELQAQSKEVEEAINSLRALGNQLTREKLLDLMIDAPNDTRLGTLVSLTRQGLDYSFFQLLTERIEKAEGEERKRLGAMRELILTITREIDQQAEARQKQALQVLEALVKAKDVQQATLETLPELDETFGKLLQSELEAARKAGNLERSAKLNQIMEVIQQASMPPEIKLIEELLGIEDEDVLKHRLQTQPELSSQEMLDMLMNLVNQMQNGGDEELAERVRRLYKLALRQSMKANLSK